MSHRSRKIRISSSRGGEACCGWWWCAVVVVVISLAASVAVGVPTTYQEHEHHLSKRFFEGKCKGVYDQRIFAKLERICEDCYELFHEPSVHQMCKEKCFTTKIFKGCIDTLLYYPEEIEEIKEMVKQINGAAVPPDLGRSVSRPHFSKSASNS